MLSCDVSKVYCFQVVKLMALPRPQMISNYARISAQKVSREELNLSILFVYDSADKLGMSINLSTHQKVIVFTIPSFSLS